MDRTAEGRLLPNWRFKRSRPARDASQARILVVGNDSVFKSRVVQELRTAPNAANFLNNAGAPFVKRELFFEEPEVIDTTHFETVNDRSRGDTARIWISQNSLRQRSGQVVCVVCTIALADVDDEIFLEPNFERNVFSWLHVLACVFEDSKKKIMFLVNCSDSGRHTTQERLGSVLERHGFRSENIIFTLQTVMRSNVSLGRAGDNTTTERKEETTKTFEAEEDHPSAAVPHFPLPKIPQGGSGMYGPWGPQNVILFGLSGNGKSTFAKMLTTGRLDGVDCLSTKFATSSSLRGQTTEVIVGQGRGWRVVDTPGLGESNDDKLRGISTDGAARLIRKYVSLVGGVYAHCIFMLKRGRVTPEEKTLWIIFNKMFRIEGDNHLTIVVSGADPEWIDKNKSYLQQHFPGCSSFIPANFESIDPEMVGDTELEEDLEKTRSDSLKAVEAHLASLCRLDVSCRWGKWSKDTQRSLLARGEDDFIKLGTHMRQSWAFGPSADLEPQPSDYITCRYLLRVKSWTTRKFLGGRKLDLAKPMEESGASFVRA